MTPRARLRAECDSIFSSIIRSQGYCEICGDRYHLECAHIIRRGHEGVRWDTDNAVCLCAACHQRYTDSDHAWKAWVARTRGETFWAMLLERHHTDPRPDLHGTRWRLRALKKLREST